MEPIYNLDSQNASLDNKIVAGLDRISQVFKTLLLEKSKDYGLSPIQIQILIFIHYHSEDKATVSYLSQEFNLSKPTISETIRILEQKQYIHKITDQNDSRSYTVQITESGKNMVRQTEDFTHPFTGIIANVGADEKLILWENITNIIAQLKNDQIISIQRTCSQCRHYATDGNGSFCRLLNQQLKTKDIRIDCAEFAQLW